MVQCTWCAFLSWKQGYRERCAFPAAFSSFAEQYAKTVVFRVRATTGHQGGSKLEKRQGKKQKWYFCYYVYKILQSGEDC